MKYVIFIFLLRAVVCFGAGLSLDVLEALSVVDFMLDELYLERVDVRLYMRFVVLKLRCTFALKWGKKMY